MHERSIDQSTYKEQVNLLNEEITLAELEIHDSKLEELDLEAALNLRRMGWATPRHFGFNARSIKNSDSKKVLFPNGLVFDSESYRTVETRLVFSYLREIAGDELARSYYA